MYKDSNDATEHEKALKTNLLKNKISVEECDREVCSCQYLVEQAGELLLQVKNQYRKQVAKLLKSMYSHLEIKSVNVEHTTYPEVKHYYSIIIPYENVWGDGDGYVMAKHMIAEVKKHAGLDIDLVIIGQRKGNKKGSK